jgi:hypothetical protein
MANVENETPNPILQFAGAAAFQKTAWAVGKIYVVCSISLLRDLLPSEASH